jgi:hypothetical protein
VIVIFVPVLFVHRLYVPNSKITKSRKKTLEMILILPNGLYDENELNNYIQEYFGTFETPPFYFDVNYATNRFMLIIRYIDYEIDFSHGKIHEHLGFD